MYVPDQVLGNDSGCTHTSTDQTSSSDEDSPMDNKRELGQFTASFHKKKSRKQKKYTKQKKNAPCSTSNTETNTEGDAEKGPHVRTDGQQEIAHVELFTRARQQHVKTDETQARDG